MKNHITYTATLLIAYFSLIWLCVGFHNNELCIITNDNNKYFIQEKTLQMCTNLKDKNNVFVYVGDKLKHNEGKEFEVSFHDIKGIILSEINGSSEFFNGTPYWIDDCEIIN